MIISKRFTPDLRDNLFPDTSCGRIFESDDDITEILKVGSTFHDKRVSLIISSIGVVRI